VLAPVAVAALWLGGPFFAVLVLVGAALGAWEWGRLCGQGRLGSAGILVIVAIVAAVLCAAAGWPAVALAIAVLGALAVFAAARAAGAATPALSALGVLWIGIPCVALLWLAATPVYLASAAADGRSTLLWLFALVWATDIGAYAAGKTIGGPRLAPRMSPSKTWAGLVGGIVAAGLVGLVTSLVLSTASFSLVLVSAALAVVEQFGDLAESVVKRRFGVKDSSALIPGHGGMLDRVDGLLAVTPVVALLSLLEKAAF
jgi:phosphatidate cytidylyltransferase